MPEIIREHVAGKYCLQAPYTKAEPGQRASSTSDELEKGVVSKGRLRWFQRNGLGSALPNKSKKPWPKWEEVVGPDGLFYLSKLNSYANVRKEK